MPVLLQICVEGNTGSTGRIAEALGKLVILNGWDSYIAHGRFPRPSESKIIKIGSGSDIFMHGLQTRLFDRHCLGSVKATEKLVDKIKAIKPDIIHLHHLHGYYINIEVLFDYLSIASIPVVWTFHDCWSITGHCCYFDYAGCQKWQQECNNCPQKHEYPASYFIDRSKKNYYLKKKLFTSVNKMVVVSVSRWLNEIVEQSFFKDVEKQVIYNGVNTDIFKRSGNAGYVRERYNAEDKFLILGVAKPWSRRKNLKDFIELSKYIDHKCIILLVGLDEKQRKNLPGNIIGLEKTENQTELKDLYASADLFMNLSEEETFGLTTAEALSCGTPAVVYNATACPELVDANTGFVIPKNNIKGLLQTIEEVRTNGKKFYSQNCRNRVLKYFNQDDRYAEYFALYKSLINNHS
jgi:putative colanic acid biosynthesis glycosyltransferase